MIDNIINWPLAIVLVTIVIGSLVYVMPARLERKQERDAIYKKWENRKDDIERMLAARDRKAPLPAPTNDE